MSNHFSSDNLRYPGDDTRLDLTDVFAFKSDEDPGKTVLIVDSNPTIRPPDGLPPNVITSRDFHPGAVYRINIDDDGDAQADTAFTFTFSEPADGIQTGTAYYATEADAREPGPAGTVLASSIPVSFGAMAQPVEAEGIRIFAGARSDPFFADIEGALHGFQWTGHDDFAGNDVFSIALEVPDDMLGAGPMVGIWASISQYHDGMLTQMDRGGNPTINPFINPDGEKNLYNSRQPADDVANYLSPWSKLLENGGYPPEEATEAALMDLPDILRYDRSQPAAYPNGRFLTDDVYSMRFAWLSHGKVPPTGLKPHGDMQSSFPYLGVPNM
ncbi:MAG TPA: DUF4331 family protein [Streptosporangiaceae bacterium]|nr:DUF4331 family protein [Streptosporangiaceae bacterium]